LTIKTVAPVLRVAKATPNHGLSGPFALTI
jgi:hypothetical protein